MTSEAARGVPVNLGNPEEMSVAKLVDLVLARTASRSRVIYLPLPEDDPRRRRPDISRALALLDWRPETNLGQGLSATIDWFRSSIEQRECNRELVAAE
jgi:UDP-glucuronate decarboxylase